MAQSYGKKLLEEVKEENLAEILREIRVNGGPDASETASYGLGIAPLDKLCGIFRAGSEKTTGEAAGYPAVIEITSPASGDGKTSLLYYVIAVGILPSDINGIHLGGRARAVVFLDTDYRFDARRLREVMHGVVQHRYQKRNHEPEDSKEQYDIVNIVNDCLRHVHVFRPQSSLALLSTIRSLESYLYSQHSSTSRSLHAVILDSASAFYWQDRREAEVSSIPGAREAAGMREQGSQSMVQIARDTVHGLQHLQHVFSCPVLYTTWGMQHRAHQTVEHPAYTPFHRFRPHLLHPWASFPTVRLVVCRDAVRSFPVGTTIDEAEGEADARQRVLARGEFTAWVDPSGSEVDIVRNGAFGFWVRREGVGLNQSDIL